MYFDQSIENVVQNLNSDIDKGLSKEEVKNRLNKYGKNAIASEKKKSAVIIFLSQFNTPMIYILIISAVISFFLNEVIDAIIIFIVVFLNAIIGLIQENKAEKALENLKKLSHPIAYVRREGKEIEIDKEEIVPGDILILEEGQIVAADVRLISGVDLEVDESMLTGESNSVHKSSDSLVLKDASINEQSNILFMSTPIIKGHGLGIVIQTGMKTQVGQIAKLLKDHKETKTPLQMKLSDLGKDLGILTVIICTLMFLVAIFRKYNPLEMMITSISLGVAAIPEGLPTVVTIVLSMGVMRMVKVHTIVRKLPAVETLGSVSVVCSDKTGTITKNQQEIVKTFILPYQSDIFFEGLLLATNASENRGDPLELAIIRFMNQKGLNKEKLNKLFPRIKEIPFSSKVKTMSSINFYHQEKIQFTKGAPDILLDKSKYCLKEKVEPLTKDEKIKIEYQIDQMGQDGLRVLALVYKNYQEGNTDDDFIFLGLIGMMDPPRDEVVSAVRSLKHAGIKPVMITGDHPKTALAIAKKINIANSETEVCTGKELENYDDEKLKNIVLDKSVFARVSPSHKVRIVKAFQANQQIVAMTGDGVNDAPSLKTADIGIAMGGNGTEVAKSAADIILSDDNFASIEKAVKEGRGIYQNIKKAVLFLLSSNFGEVLVMFITLVLGLPTPLIAIHILWVNLISDTLPALALGADPKSNNIMDEKPRKKNESLFAHGGIFLTIIYSLCISLVTLFSYILLPSLSLFQQGYELRNFKEFYDQLIILFRNESVLMKARTFAFTTLGVCQLFHMIGMRDITTSFIKGIKKKNIWILIAIVFGLSLQFMVTEIPIFVSIFKTTKLEWNEWGYLLLISSIPLWVHELFVPYFKKKSH